MAHRRLKISRSFHQAAAINRDKSCFSEVSLAAPKQNTAPILVLQHIEATASAAHPEILDGMRVGKLLAGWMVLMEARKKTAPPIVERRATIRVATNRKHETPQGRIPLEVSDRLRTSHARGPWDVQGP